MKNYEHLRIPKYVQLMIKLKEQIEQEVLKPGDPLPTRDRLMREHELSLSTVTRAINELERQGWLISRQGSGTFVVKRSKASHEIDVEPKKFGLLIPVSEYNAFELTQELSAEAKNKNIRLIVLFSPDDEEAELDQAKFLFENGVDGLIWFPVRPKKHIGVASLFVKNQKPVVICENVTDKLGPYSISVYRDYYGGMRDAIQYLIGLGHQRIAYIGPKNNESDFGPIPERWNAYRDLMKELNLWEPDELVLQPTLFQEWQHHSNRIKSLFEKTNAPTAIIGYNDQIALDVAGCLSSLGFKLPEEISIIGNEDSVASQYSHPRLTTVSMCHAEYVDAIFRGVEQLYKKEDSNGNDRTITVPQRLIQRESAKQVGDIMIQN